MGLLAILRCQAPFASGVIDLHLILDWPLPEDTDVSQIHELASATQLKMGITKYIDGVWKMSIIEMWAGNQMEEHVFAACVSEAHARGARNAANERPSESSNG